MRRARGHLGQRDPLIAPRHDMAGAGDADRRLIIPAFHRAGGVHLEKLGMESSAVKLKNQLGNLRADGQHGGETLVRLRRSIFNSSHVRLLDFMRKPRGEQRVIFFALAAS